MANFSFSGLKEENLCFPYQDKNRCPACGGANKTSYHSTLDAGNPTVTDCDTECKACGHENMWEYGYFSIPVRPKNKEVF